MFTIEQSLLLVIDIQEKLIPLIYKRDQVVKNQQNLIKAAEWLHIPIIWTEQVPEKIGSTIPEIRSLLNKIQPIEKISFSCVPNKRFMQALSELNRKQVILCGIEAHVCIYQTAMDLIGSGYQVQVACDAVSSRTKENKDIALEQIKSDGGRLTSTEMILTELIRSAEHPQFKQIIALIK